MNRRKIKAIFLIALGIFIAFSILNNDNLNFNAGNSDEINLDNENIRISAVSGKIHIDNNWTATESTYSWCTGSGTFSDPYIIEDLVIDGGASGSCILIGNSSVFFKIENCTVYNSVVSTDAGIRLSYVNNSQLINNNCSANYRGILLFNSGNNTVSGNIANNNADCGVSLLESDSNTISGNAANYNLQDGIYLGDSSDYNTVSGNYINDNIDNGIFLFYSDYNTVTGNTANDNHDFGIHSNRGHHNTISGNTVNNNNDDGIYLTFSEYNTVSGNIAKNNIEDGIRLAGSNNNTISANTASNNTNGIYLHSSESNTISGNILAGNDVCLYEDVTCNYNVFENNDCGEGGGIPWVWIIIASVIGGVVVIAVAVVILIRRKRK